MQVLSNPSKLFKGAGLTALTLLVLGGCTGQEAKEDKKKVTDMKCGAGKCGANMFDGNRALAKKKANILSQMREEDPREACVKNSQTTKALYNCVRDPKTGKLSLKCGSKKEPAMKCGTGKCGGSM